MFTQEGKLQGVEAVIDKDWATALLARELDADFLIMATDVNAVYVNWNRLGSKAIRRISPTVLRNFEFDPGSMGVKIDAAREFAELTGKVAAIGALSDLPAVLEGDAGTWITVDQEGTEWW